MTGIRFMDELTMPRSRRSTVGPGQLRPRSRGRSSATAEDLGESVAEEPIPLAEFAVAMAVDMPRMDLYTAITRDLTAYIQEDPSQLIQMPRCFLPNYYLPVKA